MGRVWRTMVTAAALVGCSSDSDGSTASSGTTPTCKAAASPEGAEAGDHFPDARITACNGTQVTLDTIRCANELTWISVGASWCGPCQEEAPELQAAHEKHGGDGVGIVQVLFQGPSSAAATTLDCQSWSEQYALTLPVYVDPVGNTVVGFDGGVTQTPLNIVLDRDGFVLWSHTGQLDPGGVEATIQSLH